MIIEDLYSLLKIKIDLKGGGVCVFVCVLISV